MKFGRYELYRSERTAVDDPGAYRERLETLAGILAGTNWLLAGGLTIPLVLGQFYRRHYDVDVAFPVEEFPRIERAMERAGYFLSTYFPMSLFGALPFALSAPVRAEGWLVRRRPRKLKFRRRAGRGAPLLTSIDALPYRITDDRFVTCDGRFDFPLRHPLVGHRERTRAGDDIPCLHLHYVGAIKESLPEPKHALDLRMIAAAAQPPASRSIPTYAANSSDAASTARIVRRV